MVLNRLVRLVIFKWGYEPGGSLVRTPTKLCARWAKAEAMISITTTDAPMAGAGGTAVVRQTIC